MKPVRLYGCFTGHSSFATVTAGWREALQAHDMLHDCFSMRTTTDFLPDGERTPIALVADVNEVMAALGNGHSEVHLVLALHSDWIPPSLMPVLLDERVTVLAPSMDTIEHLKKVIAAEQRVKGTLVEHGVDKGFQPLTKEQTEELAGKPIYAQLRHPNSDFMNLLHMCESSTARKGTYVLLRAFDRACQSDDFQAVLTIVPSAMEHGAIHAAIGALDCKDRVRLLPRLNAPAEKIKWIYSCFDAIIQPSRAEGFGLVPLEGLVMGKPCAVTERTGHEQWYKSRREVEEGDWASFKEEVLPGVVVVKAGAPGPPLFEPAPAPVVTESAVWDALQALYWTEHELTEGARMNAAALREKTRWPLVVRGWADWIKERYA